MYTISFLGVMTLFAVGTLILRKSRPDLERTYYAPILFIILAGSATFIGIIGNIIINPDNLTFFLTYFIPTFLIVLIVMYQEYILAFLMQLTKQNSKIHKTIYKYFDDAIDGNFIVFVKHPDQIFKALKYIDTNEVGRNINIIHCQSKNDKKFKSSYQNLVDIIPFFKKANIFAHLQTNLTCLDEKFSPKTVRTIAKKLQIPLNRVLIGSIEKEHPFTYDQFGGVRIIF